MAQHFRYREAQHDHQHDATVVDQAVNNATKAIKRATEQFLTTISQCACTSAIKNTFAGNGPSMRELTQSLAMGGPIEHLEAHVSVDSPDDNPVDLLQQATGLSKQRIKLAMTSGAVWMTRGRNTQRLRRAKRQLRPGDELHIYYDAFILAEVPKEAELIADVGGYSVWNKPFGLRSQGSKWGDHCTVVRWAERHLQPERPAFTVHRLDRAANGLILVAHSKTIAAALSKLFRERRVKKHYRALVQGDFSTHASPLRVEQPLDEKDAVSEFRFVEQIDGGNRSVLDVSIETGRKHQIRRHLASMGHAVVGDRLYGSGNDDGMDLQLSACRLKFHCPVADELVQYALTAERSD